jgi:hypothetical protein
MSYDFSELVYRGIINYRDGNWYGECCQVMRPVYDLENWMAEYGYYPDGLNAAGNPKWVHRVINQLGEYYGKSGLDDDSTGDAR